MLVDFFKAAKQDPKATVKTKQLTDRKYYPTEDVLLVIEYKDKVRILDFHGSRENKSGYANTLYGNFNWPSDFPKIDIGMKTPMEVLETAIYFNQTERNLKVKQIQEKYGKRMFGYKDLNLLEAKPRPQPFPQGYLSPFIEEQFNKTEDKCEKINPLDERLERLKVEINAALILAGGTHKGDHSIGEFRNVMSNVLSNVDKKTLIKIIENAYF